MGSGWQAAISGAIAGSVGLTELLGRYRSSPAFSITQLPAMGYVLVNVAAGVLALYLVRAFNWTFGQVDNVTLWRILVSGFGALALFRSSLFVTKIGGTEVNVGPSVVLGAFLDACNRAVDRASAQRLSAGIADSKVADLNPDAVGSALPVLCLALMQNFAPSDQALLAAELNKIQQDTVSPDVQMRAVILQLSKHLGHAVVEKVLADARSVFTSQPTNSAAPVRAATPPPTPLETAAVLTQARALGQEQSAEPGPAPTEPDGTT